MLQLQIALHLHCIAWSPDSTASAVVLDTGVTSFFMTSATSAAASITVISSFSFLSSYLARGTFPCLYSHSLDPTFPPRSLQFFIQSLARLSQSSTRFGQYFSCTYSKSWLPPHHFSITMSGWKIPSSKISGLNLTFSRVMGSTNGMMIFKVAVTMKGTLMNMASPSLSG